MSDFTHLDDEGRIRMVDISEKAATFRWAKAKAGLRLSEELFAKLKDKYLEKGDALAAARIAGIQAAKRTSELIPLCHPISITHAEVSITLDPPNRIHIRTEVRTQASTGVEMEALTAAMAAALTIYDMGKAVDRGIVIEEVKLIEKGGGRSGTWRRPEDDSKGDPGLR